MSRLVAAVLAVVTVLLSAAVAAAFTPLSGHYVGKETGGVAVSFDFDGAHISHIRVDHHLANAWSIPRYNSPNFSGGNSDGGFFSGHWNDPTHLSGSYRFLSRTTIHKFTLHRVPQPKPGRYHGTASNGSAVSFTLDHHRVRHFNAGYVNNVSAEQRGPKFIFIGVNHSRNTTVEGHWTSDRHLKGAVRQTGRDEITWTADWDAR